jgi:hypothetical protein
MEGESIVSTTLRPEIINAAIQGFEAQRQHLDAQIGELRALLNGAQPKAVGEPQEGIRRKVSAAARKRMAEGQRKRWAAAKGTSEPAMAQPTKRKRRLSTAGRAAIVAALKKRWANKKAAWNEVASKKIPQKKVAARKVA